MLGNSGIAELLLLERVLGRSLEHDNPFDMIEKVRKWDSEEAKKAKEKADKAKAGSPNKPIFSIRDFTLALFGFAIPGGLLLIQLYIYLWNSTYDMVLTMHH